MSSRSHYAADIIARSIALAMKLPGGMSVLIRPSLLERYGWKRIRCRQFRIKRASKARPPYQQPRSEKCWSAAAQTNPKRRNKPNWETACVSMTSSRQIEAWCLRRSIKEATKMNFSTDHDYSQVVSPESLERELKRVRAAAAGAAQAVFGPRSLEA
jgi:hypothetical protein